MSVEILASKKAERELRQLVKNGGPSKLAYQTLTRSLADMSGRVEPKGAGMYGIDLPGGHRTMFTFNQQRQPVLVFIGNHREYDNLSPDARSRLAQDAQNPVQVSLSSSNVTKDVPLAQYIENMTQAGPLSSGKVCVARDMPVRPQNLKGQFGKETARRAQTSYSLRQKNNHTGSKPPSSSL